MNSALLYTAMSATNQRQHSQIILGVVKLSVFTTQASISLRVRTRKPSSQHFKYCNISGFYFANALRYESRARVTLVWGCGLIELRSIIAPLDEYCRATSRVEAPCAGTQIEYYIYIFKIRWARLGTKLKHGVLIE